MKADMQRQMDELHTQLHYWQNITIAILRDQHHVNTGGEPSLYRSNSIVEMFFCTSVDRISH